MNEAELLAKRTAETNGRCRLYVDDREDGRLAREFLQAVEKIPELTVQRGTVFSDRLPIGDYAVCMKVKPEDDDVSIRMIIERKSYQDLCASISDDGNRWNNQKARMLQFRKEYPDTICIYIIEIGDSVPDSYFMRMAGDLVDLGICVVHTKNIEETVHYLLRRRHLLSKTNSTDELVGLHLAMYREFRGKKNTVKPENFLAETLKIIPGITPSAAQNIASNYESVADFVARCTPEDLVGTQYKTKNNTDAHIGKKRADTVVSMLWSESGINRARVQRIIEKGMRIPIEVNLEKKRKSQAKEKKAKRNKKS